MLVIYTSTPGLNIKFEGLLEHFTLRPLVEWTKDFGNLNGGEQKFVHSAFTLNANA
jgi:hypothetical protein